MREDSSDRYCLDRENVCAQVLIHLFISLDGTSSVQMNRRNTQELLLSLEYRRACSPLEKIINCHSDH